MVSLTNLSRGLTFCSALMILGMGGNHTYRNYKLFDKYETQAKTEAAIISEVQEKYVQTLKDAPVEVFDRFDIDSMQKSYLFRIVREHVDRENEAKFYNRAKKNPLLIHYYTWLVNHQYGNPIEENLYHSFLERHENNGVRQIDLFD